MIFISSLISFSDNMNQEHIIKGLVELANFLEVYIKTSEEEMTSEQQELLSLMKRSEVENPWFTQDNQRFCLSYWAQTLNEKNIQEWLQKYNVPKTSKKIGLILAGNIPLVGLHDVLCVLLSNHEALIKLSSKDRLLLPFLLKKWNEFAAGVLSYSFVEKLSDYDAVIATGSNNTARYLEYYFKDKLSIIRKNRTSVAVLTGKETNEELQLLAEDIFRYFGLGCRNVTRLFLPEEFELSRLFENFLHFKEVINHHKYANNYDYNRAVYLLNQEQFWDNNFVMLKEDEKLFSPLSVINFSRYKAQEEVFSFLEDNKENIQCIVAYEDLKILDAIKLGDAQYPSLSTYADNVDTMQFLSQV